MHVGQQLWEIQEGRFGSPVPADIVTILASEMGISTDMLEFEKILRRHNVNGSTSFVTDVQSNGDNLLLHKITNLAVFLLQNLDDVVNSDFVCFTILHTYCSLRGGLTMLIVHEMLVSLVIYVTLLFSLSS